MERVNNHLPLLVFDYFDNNANKGQGIYPLHLKMQDLAGIINAFRQGID
jgi:hypothetical protein